MFARELNGTLHCIHHLRFQSPRHAPAKYVLQAARTLRVLFRDRPAAVHVQNPPFVCALVVQAYCRVSGARYAIEHHSAAFARVWDWARPFQRFVVRGAATNIVTNDHWAAVIASWGGRALVMYDAFLELPPRAPFPVGPGPNVAFLGTFAPDEPIDAVLAAARLTPHVRFYVTGDRRKIPADVAASAPPNVTFTGFLDPDGEYVGLLRAVDVAMVLTTRDHTLQLAGCEAIAVGTPLITSDWAYLRTLFAGGTVFTGHSPDAIAKAVTEAVERRGQLAAEIPALRELRHREWQQQLRALRRAVESTHGAEAEDVAIRTDEGPALASGRPGRGFDER
jgi:glycosyltransferase involved in cell wall biosynthesis